VAIGGSLAASTGLINFRAGSAAAFLTPTARGKRDPS